MYQNTTHSYGRVARAFHWLTGLIILGNIGLGLAASRIPLEQIELKVQLFSWHKTLGIAALTVASLRILWALSQPRPVPVHPERRVETFIAETVHWLLYASLVLVPVTGWIEHAATDGFAPILWPLGQGLPLVPKSPALALTMAAVHHIFAWLLIASIALHVAGALKHALLERDGVLSRMLHGTRAGGRRAGHHRLAALAAAVVLGTGAAYALTTRPPEREATTRLEQAASDWQVTAGSLGFTVRQMGSEVQGAFDDWTASITFDPDSGEGRVKVQINMDSVTIGTVTDQAKGADFFDVSQHPVAVFDGTIRPEGDRHVAEGPLTLKGLTVPVTLVFDLEIRDGVAQMRGRAALDRRNWQVGQGYDDESTVGFTVDLDVALTAQRAGT
ncbi:cytochrome b/b6 domain-containing protein [Paracoccus rhizosphaerae]|uniref:Cytochrome b/b6 domain-containing protein n=1 Tax=Paracoccus rhizosphaerae TaxID=1133347 RepID=A0ABV6CMS1_9RHOB|nr:cytochrome b/b6 domain-containing protein [Paracoccus rhizosphaerae]